MGCRRLCTNRGWGRARGGGTVGEGPTCVMTGTHPPAASKVSASNARLDIKHDMHSNSLHKLQITFCSRSTRK